VDAQTIEQLARYVGLEIPEIDLEVLEPALANQAAMIEILDRLELDDGEPIVTFDPRWR
jgi:hypothetical protein